MEKIKSYKDLIVYKKAYELALMIYKLTKDFPDVEKYGMISQIRRSCISIPCNIAEGYRRGKKEYIQFLKIAYGSCAELETQLSLSKDLGFISDKEKFENIYNLQNEVSKLLGTIIHKISKGEGK
ncbi:MAG: four helix bundle protein [Thermodesulfovibrionia bacterium]|nr:four helix bundle protein [Thermodesulfovibrionia bacterium]